MKKMMVLALLLMSLVSFTNPPVDFKDNWVYELGKKKPMYGPIEVEYCYYNSPCNGIISAKITSFYTDVNPRRIALYINFSNNGTTLGTVQYVTMPAYANELHVFTYGTDIYCSSTITWYDANWYTPQW